MVDRNQLPNYLSGKVDAAEDQTASDQMRQALLTAWLIQHGPPTISDAVAKKRAKFDQARQMLKTSWVTRPGALFLTQLNILRERLPEPMRAKVVGVFAYPKARVVEYASGDITVIPAATWDDDTTVARICLECP